VAYPEVLEPARIDQITYMWPRAVPAFCQHAHRI